MKLNVSCFSGAALNSVLQV